MIIIFYCNNPISKSWKEYYLISFLNTHLRYLVLLINSIILAGYFYPLRDNLALQKETFYTHYIKQFQQKKDLVTLVQLLMFVRNLDYQEVTLTSKFRRFQFPVRDFLNYIHPGRSTHHYQRKQLIEFFDTLTKNSIIQSFTDEHYKMLVTIHLR